MFRHVVMSRNNSVVVKHGWCCCCVKHPERSHVKLRDEASLRRLKCGGQYKWELMLLCQKASFSGDALECVLWSSIGECGQHLDGHPLHVTKWLQLSDSGVWWRPVSGRMPVELWAFVAMKGWGFIWVETWFRPGTTVVAMMNGGCCCWAGAKQSASLKMGGGGVAHSIIRDLYCLARELDLWRCGRVSLLITQVYIFYGVWVLIILYFLLKLHYTLFLSTSSFTICIPNSHIP
jgi:hypothetical protein